MSAQSPALVLADRIKVYRLTMSKTGIFITLDAEQAEALEDVLRQSVVLATARAQVRAEVDQAQSTLSLIRREAKRVILWTGLLSLFCIAWAAAIVGALS